MSESQRAWLSLAASLLLLAASLAWVEMDRDRRGRLVPTPVPPTPTLWIVVITVTPPAVEAGPVLPTRTAMAPTATFTPIPDRVPMTPLPTRTPTLVPPTPDWLPTVAPARSPIQRGNHAATVRSV